MFKSSLNVPIYLLFSNFAWGLALDRRVALYLGQRRTKVKAKALIKYEVKKSRLVKDLTLRGPMGR